MSWNNSGIDRSMDLDLDKPIIPDVVQESDILTSTSGKDMHPLTKMEAKFKLRGLKYDIDHETIEFIDDAGVKKRVKLLIFDIRAMQKRIKEIDKELQKEDLGKREKRKLFDEKKIINQSISFYRDAGPAFGSNEIKMTSEILSKMSKEDLEGIITHEGEHWRQLNRKNGIDASGFGTMVLDDAELEFMKDYLANTENGKRLSKNEHDGRLFEMTADAAAVKKYGAKKYAASLKKLINVTFSYDTIYRGMVDSVTKLNADFNRASVIVQTINADSSKEISDSEMYQLFESTSSNYDRLLVTIAKLREDLGNVYVGDNSSGPFSIMFAKIKAIVKSFKPPYKYFRKSVCKELVKNLSPKERKEAIRYIYSKQCEELIGGLEKDLQTPEYQKQYKEALAKIRESMDVRIQFCYDFEKWYKHDYKKTVVEFLTICINDEDTYCEEYMLEHFAERMYEETHKIVEEAFYPTDELFNDTLYRTIFDQISNFLPGNWEKVVIWLMYGTGSFEYGFYVQQNGSMIKCFDLPGVDKFEIKGAFINIDVIVNGPRGALDEKWDNMVLTVLPDGKMHAEFNVPVVDGKTLGVGEATVPGPNSGTEKVMNQPMGGEETVQEGGFSSRFGDICKRLKEALAGKCTVSSLGMTPAFTIDSDKIHGVVSNSDNNTCTLEMRDANNDLIGKRKMTLSAAFDTIFEIFTHPETVLESAEYKSTIPSRFYQEADEDDPEDLDKLLDSAEAEGAKGESPEEDEPEENGDDESTETPEETEVDITAFGTDTSDVQNEFDPKEVDTLNKLIAAESEAINDYFDASKDSHDSNLMRLYSDIGHEERFHLEQLMYAKSTLTGEKYEPRDPEVKKEYEELLAIGMDTDTAASTAIDKVAVGSSTPDMDELTEESYMLYASMYQNEIVLETCFEASDKELEGALGTFMESFVMEEMSNMASQPKEVRNLQSPVKLLVKGLKLSINATLRLGNILKDTIVRANKSTADRIAFIKKHGIGSLFAGGIYLYFYNDKISRYDFETPEKYVDMLYNMTKMVAKAAGITLTKDAKRAPLKNPIQISNLREGIDVLRQVTLTKTKVLVNEKNEDMLAREFFGYNEGKLVAATPTSDGQNNVQQSYNIFNRLSFMQSITAEYMKISLAVCEALERMEGDVNTIFYKNRDKYNTLVKYMKAITSRYQEFIRCMAYDLNQILRLNNGLKELTEQRDVTTANGEKWKGKDIQQSGGLTNKPNDKFTK